MKLVKTFALGLMLSSMGFYSYAQEQPQCSLLVEEVESIQSADREVDRFIHESEMTSLELNKDQLRGVLNTFMAKISVAQNNSDLVLMIADSRSGKSLTQHFSSWREIRGVESASVLSVTRGESHGNYEVGSVLYINAKKVLSHEASIFCF